MHGKGCILPAYKYLQIKQFYSTYISGSNIPQFSDAFRIYLNMGITDIYAEQFSGRYSGIVKDETVKFGYMPNEGRLGSLAVSKVCILVTWTMQLCYLSILLVLSRRTEEPDPSRTHVRD